jgi:acyl dehydratase
VRVAGKVVAVAQKKPGVTVVLRFTAHDEQGLLSTTDFSALYRDVKLDGADRSVAAVDDPPKHDRALQLIGEVPVAATAAHVYTECARIWNPIHTDRAYARAAGLPDIILHGTATLALSVSKILDVLKPQVRRVRCRFAGMVLMPSTLTVHASRQGDGIAFATRNERGETVIDRGWIS